LKDEKKSRRKTRNKSRTKPLKLNQRFFREHFFFLLRVISGYTKAKVRGRKFLGESVKSPFKPGNLLSSLISARSHQISYPLLDLQPWTLFNR